MNQNQDLTTKKKKDKNWSRKSSERKANKPRNQVLDSVEIGGYILIYYYI